MNNLNYLSDFRKCATFLSCIGLILVLSGCDDRVAMAEQEMAQIRNSPSQKIEPPPQPEKVEDFVYSANKIRSPFMPPSLLDVPDQKTDNTGVQPDLTREKEPLESFDLSQLTFRGMVVAPSGEEFGLIQRPDGNVASVKVGDYLGRDDGRIVEITPTQINLIEIVPDSRSGFVEKAQSLVSPDS